MLHTSPLPRGRTAALALALGVLAAGPLAAQVDLHPDSPVTLTVRSAAGPQFRAKPRRFLAVNVILENVGDQDADGTIKVFRTKDVQKVTPDQGLFYERPVALPAGGRRVETIYYYCQENEPAHRLCVLYEPEDVPAPPPAFPRVEVVADEVAVLAVSSRPVDGPARALRAAILPGPRRPWKTTVAQADLSALPDHMAGYEAFDAVLVTDLDPDALSEAQARALLDWVAAGRSLIVAFSGRAGELDASPLRAAIPVARPTGPGVEQGPQGPDTLERDLAALRALAPGAGPPRRDRVLVDRVAPLPDGQVVAGDSVGPLIVRGRYGAGWVTYVAFPLDCAPLRRWTGVPDLGACLLRLAPEELAPAQVATAAPPLEELLLNLSEALEELTPPSAWLVAPLLVLYVVLVSPLNYKLLARRRRFGLLSQAAAAVVALVFGIVFYAVGRAYKGSEAMVTHIAVVDLAVAEGPSRVDVMTGYFSTDRGLAAAEGPRSAVLAPIALQSTSREGRVIQGGSVPRLEALTLDTWALRRFRSLRAEDLGHLAVDLRLEGGLLQGTLENRTQLRLEDPLLLLDQSYRSLGPALEPGQRVEVRGGSPQPLDESYVDLGRLGLLQDFVRDARGSYPALYGQGMGLALGGDPYGNRADRRILETLRRRLAGAPRSPDGLPGLLVARVVHDPGGVVVEGGATDVLERILVVSEVDVVLDAAEGVRLTGLQPRVLRGHNVQPVGGATGAPPVLGGNPVDEGFVELEWRVPSSPDRPFQADRIGFRWSVSPSPHLPEVSQLDAFDFEAGRWVHLTDLFHAPVRRGEARWPDPQQGAVDTSRLLDVASGAVRVRLRNVGADLSLESFVLDVFGRR